MEEPRTVEVPITLYNKLVFDSMWLNCLESAGVDNWDGISYAHELMASVEPTEDDGEF